MLQMYAIKDNKSGAFDRPFFVQHVAQATRNVQMALEEGGKSALARYPEDFSLWLIGHFDETNGGLMPTSTGAPQWTVECVSLLNKPTEGITFKTALGKEAESGT